MSECRELIGILDLDDNERDGEGKGRRDRDAATGSSLLGGDPAENLPEGWPTERENARDARSLPRILFVQGVSSRSNETRLGRT